jgi:hypothetical protein
MSLTMHVPSNRPRPQRSATGFRLSCDRPSRRTRRAVPTSACTAGGNPRRSCAAPPISGRSYRLVDRRRRVLRRRSQKDRFTWKRIEKLAADFLPKPRILHPWPSERFVVKHPRWEPDAGCVRRRQRSDGVWDRLPKSAYCGGGACACTSGGSTSALAMRECECTAAG